MSGRQAGPVRNPERATERRYGLLQLLALTGVFTLALVLLGFTPIVVVMLAVPACALTALRIFGPRQLDSSQEYALVIAADFSHDVVAALAESSLLYEQWSALGLRAAELV